jgi:uncharacterized membrane protein YoaK (UPF0700 family)
VALGALLFCPSATLLHWDEALPHLETSIALSETAAFWTDYTSPKLSLEFATVGLVTFLMGLDACFG